MPRKKILWLCSWYPNKTDRFNGDFIQRHARAASLYNDIQVIYITSAGADITHHKIVEEVYQAGSLKENITYFPRNKSFIGRIIGAYEWMRLCRKAIKKYIRENGNPALIHVQVPIKAGIAALWAKNKYDIPFVVTEHWGIYNDIVKDNYSSRNRVFKNYTRRVIRNSSFLISVSRFLAEGINDLVAEKEYRVIPNVVDTDLFYYITKENSLFRFIHVSNMVPLKNAEGILRAFHLFLKKGNKAELLMVGDKEPSIRNMAEELGLFNRSVFFHGEVAYAEVAKKMQSSHCLVLFSNIENSPCVIGEAQSCGLPVIATSVGGIPELVNKDNGVFIEAGNEEGLATKLEIIMHDYSQYNLSKIASEAKSKFGYLTIGKSLDDIYETVLQNGL